MLLLVTLAVLAWVLWRGALGFGAGLVAAGLVVQLLQLGRLVRASAGGAGGHAEWVRDVSTRRRLRESPIWLLAAGLVAAGAAVSFFG
jgi:hypothetical protein